MTGVSELKAQHGAIRIAARHLLDVAVAARGYRAAASGLLHDLGTAIAAHTAAEAGFAWHDGTAERALLDRLAREWQAYRATWSTCRIAADWAGFAAATHALLPRMLARLDHEEARLDRAAALGR